MKKNINSRNIPFTMKFGRNIAPFLGSVVVMIAVCGSFSVAAPRAGVVTEAGSLSDITRFGVVTEVGSMSAAPRAVDFTEAGSMSVAPQASAPQDRKTFRYAVSLYDRGMYERAAEIFAVLAGAGAIAWDNSAVAAGDSFDAHMNGLGAMEIDFNGAVDIEALGYYVLCAVKMQTRGYTVLANSYILKYPYGSLVPQIRFAHAITCFDVGDYKGVDNQLEPLSRRKLYHRQVPDFLFMRALSRLELGEDDAKDLFADVINYKKSNRYVLPAHYFLGYILYEEGNLSEAKEHFALAVADPRFRELAGGYLVKCGGSVAESAGVAAGGAANAVSAGATGAGASSGTAGGAANAVSDGALAGVTSAGASAGAGSGAVAGATSSGGAGSGASTGVAQNSDGSANQTSVTTETTETTSTTETESAATGTTPAATGATETETVETTSATETETGATETTEDAETLAQAKEYLADNQRGKAMSLLKKLAADPSTETGGEAAYLIVIDSYDRGKFSDVEDHVLDFSEADNPNQYWLAKAFIVLGDSYAEQGEFAKALATFESVRDGYNPTEPNDAKDDLDVRIRKAEEMLNKKK